MQNIIDIHNQFILSDGVAIDSREIVSNKIFFALSGDNFNGNKFAKEAAAKGAKLCVVDDEQYKTQNCIIVNDVLTTLQLVAKYHREQNKATVLAITGSNGKTTTKELITSVLKDHISIISTSGNFNNHIGVPLTLLKIKQNTKIAVVEMGANHIGEINALCNIAQPNVGIITNIGKAHLEGFGSLEGVIKAKSELFNYIINNNGKLIVNNDDELLVKLAKKSHYFTYGSVNSNITGKIINLKPTITINWVSGSTSNNCTTKLYGNYNFYNIMTAIATGVFFKVPNYIINKGIESYDPKNNRSQKIKTANNSVILDAYNANPTSMTGAITSFTESGFVNSYLILGDMMELGNYSEVEHQHIVNELTDTKINNIILIGNNFYNTKDHNFLKFTSTIEAKQYLAKNKINKATILIKGSRSMKLEELVDVL